MPSVMSTDVRRHATHVFVGLGSIAVPHTQHRLGGIKTQRQSSRLCEAGIRSHILCATEGSPSGGRYSMPASIMHDDQLGLLY